MVKIVRVIKIAYCVIKACCSSGTVEISIKSFKITSYSWLYIFFPSFHYSRSLWASFSIIVHNTKEPSKWARKYVISYCWYIPFTYKSIFPKVMIYSAKSINCVNIFYATGTTFFMNIATTIMLSPTPPHICRGVK